MTELKTLKDLSAENMCCQQRLRFEAIKWIKEIDNFEKSPDDKLWEALTGNTIRYSDESKWGIRNFIKHFFNISETEIENA